jgi:hypothetical protein
VAAPIRAGTLRVVDGNPASIGRVSDRPLGCGDRDAGCRAVFFECRRRGGAMTLRRSPWETTARGEVGLRTLDSGETDPQRLAGTNAPTNTAVRRTHTHATGRESGNRTRQPSSEGTPIALGASKTRAAELRVEQDYWVGWIVSSPVERSAMVGHDARAGGLAVASSRMARRGRRPRGGRSRRRRKGCRGRYSPRDGYTTMKFGWLGIFTFGRVCAFISSVSPMIPLR